MLATRATNKRCCSAHSIPPSSCLTWQNRAPPPASHSSNTHCPVVIMTGWVLGRCVGWLKSGGGATESKAWASMRSGGRWRLGSGQTPSRGTPTSTYLHTQSGTFNTLLHLPARTPGWGAWAGQQPPESRTSHGAWACRGRDLQANSAQAMATTQLDDTGTVQ